MAIKDRTIFDVLDGLVATNSIRGGANRMVLEPIAEAGAIIEAWSDEPWTIDGAAVRPGKVLAIGRQIRVNPFNRYRIKISCLFRKKVDHSRYPNGWRGAGFLLQ